MKKFISALLAVLACLCFVACTPSSVKKAEEKMKKEGYGVTAYSGDEEGLVGGLIAMKTEEWELDTITALLFETKDDAKDFAEKTSETGAVQDGKWVYWGTEDAIEDFTD